MVCKYFKQIGYIFAAYDVSAYLWCLLFNVSRNNQNHSRDQKKVTFVQNNSALIRRLPYSMVVDIPNAARKAAPQSVVNLHPGNETGREQQRPNPRQPYSRAVDIPKAARKAATLIHRQPAVEVVPAEESYNSKAA